VNTPRTYAKVARAAAEEATRTALLDAAERAFFDDDWDRLSLEAIARSAGVTKQTLLRHYGSKDGLLERAFARAFDHVRGQRLRAPADDIEGALDNLLDHYEELGGRALRIGAMSGGGLVAEMGRAARQLHYDWVEHAFGGWLAAVSGQQRRRLHAALIVACDVQTWSILANDLGFPRAEVRATLLLTIRRLLGEDT
jgi:AcrR family transcriptional regulator